MNIPVNLEAVYIQPVSSEILQAKAISAAVLRLDQLHAVISGNKWFKLKYYLADAIKGGYRGVATFGGAWSNHLAATAHTCKAMGIPCLGIIRGEASATLSHTLQQVQQDGMQLEFVSRTDFRNKENILQRLRDKGWYCVDEGGYGDLGAKGASEIFQWIDSSYTHILCATGTGTMMAGLIRASNNGQKVTGINSMKHEGLIDAVNDLLDKEDRLKPYEIMHDYHFGGYAKHPASLIEFMNQTYHEQHLPTDIIYTSKLCYGFFDLAGRDYFPSGSNVMLIHSGGLQGNLSLPEGRLAYEV